MTTPELFTQLTEALKRTSCYLVGGAVRDLLLGRPLKDIDLVLEGDPWEWGNRLARLFKGAPFFLKEEQQAVRVVFQSNHATLQIDLLPLRTSILQDLRERDYTINAMGIELNQIVPLLPDRLTPENLTPLILDPTGGREDLSQRLVRMTSPTALWRDPVRLLRGVRIAGDLDFRLEEETASTLQLLAPSLQQPAIERVRDELLMILAFPAHRGVDLLVELGLLWEVLPELNRLKGVEQNTYHHLPAWEHTLEALRQLDVVLSEGFLPADVREPILQHLNQPLSAPHLRLALLRFGLLFHDIGKPDTATREEDGRIRFIGHDKAGVPLVAGVSSRLRLSQKEKEYLCGLVRHHLRPLHLTNRKARHPSEKEWQGLIYRAFRDMGGITPDVLTLSLADRRASRGPAATEENEQLHYQVTIELLREWFYQAEKWHPKPLLTGEDLIQTFHLQPGPLIGQLLQKLEEAMVLEEVKTREEALIFLRQFLPAEKPPSPNPRIQGEEAGPVPSQT